MPTYENPSGDAMMAWFFLGVIVLIALGLAH